jgi:hypothetical protein
MIKGIERPQTKKHAFTGFSDGDLVEALREIFRHYGYEPATLSTDAKQEIADRLSEIARRDAPWGWRYVHNFMAGNIQAGNEFKAAIVGLASLIDGAPIQLLTGRSVNVIALGSIRPGALVYGDSRKCAFVSCPIHFIPRVWNQRYCSPDCKKRGRS